MELGKKFGMPIISVEELREHIRKNPIQASISMSMQVDDAATIISTCAPCAPGGLFVFWGWRFRSVCCVFTACH